MRKMEPHGQTGPATRARQVLALDGGLSQGRHGRPGRDHGHGE